MRGLEVILIIGVLVVLTYGGEYCNPQTFEIWLVILLSTAIHFIER